MRPTAAKLLNDDMDRCFGKHNNVFEEKACAGSFGDMERTMVELRPAP